MAKVKRFTIGLTVAALVGAWVAFAGTLPDPVLQAAALAGFMAALATAGGLALMLARNLGAIL